MAKLGSGATIVRLMSLVNKIFFGILEGRLLFGVVLETGLEWQLFRRTEVAVLQARLLVEEIVRILIDRVAVLVWGCL